MDYLKYDFQTGQSDNEILIALLSALPFDTFVENENGFEAYLPSNEYLTGVDDVVEELKTGHNFGYSKEFIKGENWNEVWESNFHPIVVGEFCGIRAEFHEPLVGVKHELVITPKMAFGTGHHETTYMVIQMMEGVDFRGRKVFDYGCGTGVLAILASKLGAGEVDAIDIEEASWSNTLENCETNGIKNVNAMQGMLPLVANKCYGIVLANINRNVILDSLPTLSGMVEPNGLLILSGILKTDIEMIYEAIGSAGFTHEKTLEKNKWVAIQCKR